MTAEQRRQKAAERARVHRERIRTDPAKLKAAREKERLRWRLRRAEGKVKYIDKMTL